MNETKYKAELLLDIQHTCPHCNKESVAKEWKAMRSQNGEYTYNTPQEAFNSIGMAYGVIGWQDEKNIEVNRQYRGVDSYGRDINIRIIKQ